MSMYERLRLDCPSCGTPVHVDVFDSINAARRPDLRERVMNDSLQSARCAKCASPCRVQPQCNYLDTRRSQWIAAYPFQARLRWSEAAEKARATFEKSYGPGAPGAARRVGATLAIRITFGWPAFREKIAATANGLDDCELELLKLALLRTQDDLPLGAAMELRLTDVEAGQLIMSSIDAETAEVVESLAVPMGAYESIATDAAAWDELRARLKSGPFVDYQRLFLEPSPRELAERAA